MILNIDGETKLYCLIGSNTRSSLSPIIHNTFFSTIKKEAVYLAFNIENDLEKAVDGLRSIGVSGFNVTMPFKENILNFLDYISPEAEKTGAVNTVKNKDGTLIGYNTDGLGFVKSLKDEAMEIVDKRILLLGAGGAAKAIAISLASENPKAIYIINRKIDKAKVLSDKVNTINSAIELETDINKIEKNDIDIIINATSIGMNDVETKLIDLERYQNVNLVCDIIYMPQKTNLLLQAEKSGIHSINGLPMLINQAILSQRIWLEKSFDYNSVVEIINNVLKLYLNKENL